MIVRIFANLVMGRKPFLTKAAIDERLNESSKIKWMP